MTAKWPSVTRDVGGDQIEFRMCPYCNEEYSNDECLTAALDEVAALRAEVEALKAREVTYLQDHEVAVNAMHEAQWREGQMAIVLHNVLDGVMQDECRTVKHGLNKALLDRANVVLSRAKMSNSEVKVTRVRGRLHESWDLTYIEIDEDDPSGPSLGELLPESAATSQVGPCESISYGPLCDFTITVEARPVKE